MAEEERLEETLWGKISGISAQAGAEDDETPLNVMAGEAARPKLDKIPLEKAVNLIALREACQGIQSGAMTKEVYRESVTKILNMSLMGVRLFECDVVRRKAESLPANEQELVLQTYEGFKKFHRGVQKMAGFLDTGDVANVQDGFTDAENAMLELDALQDKALEIAANR